MTARSHRFCKLEGQKVLFVGQHKGRNLKEREECFYGCAHPKDIAKPSEKWRWRLDSDCRSFVLSTLPAPIPELVQKNAVRHTALPTTARNVNYNTPIICVVIGEGGSGGALGIGIGDHICVMEYAYYSVISPEGCAGILWKSVQHKDKAARALKFTSKSLLAWE